MTTVTREELVRKSLETGFSDMGITSAEPFHEQRKTLESRQDSYGIFRKLGIDLIEGTDPGKILPGAKSIIVLIHVYYDTLFPRHMEGHFGRCYLDDDRVRKDGLALRIKEFRSFLRERGINSAVPFNLPHRAAAARAGLGDFGKNCLFFSRKAAGMSSWVVPVTVVIDRELEPDIPAGGIGCPAWCRNACVAACPTRALQGDGTIDPQRCISYMTYYGKEITPEELREPMGIYVYGCDICQNVCPRNRPWMSRDLPESGRVAAKAPDFLLEKLLAMDRDYFTRKIHPHMFYMSPDFLWKWKMNAARAMGNSRDESYIEPLRQAFRENDDDRVLGMIAWALGRIGGEKARLALREMQGNGNVSDAAAREISQALETAGEK